MEQKQKGLLIGIGFAVVVTAIIIWQLIDLPNAIRDAQQRTTNANRLSLVNGAVIGNVNVPPAGDPGKFQGKLEQLDFQPTDLPAVYGPYSIDKNLDQGGYSKNFSVTSEDKDSTQVYNSPTMSNFDSSPNSAWADASFSFHTFVDTSAAAHDYASTESIAKIFREPANQNFAGYNRNTQYSSFSKLGVDNVVTKSWDDLKGTEADRFATKSWSISMLISNANVGMLIKLPFAATDNDVEQVVMNWLKHIDTYQPGTPADIQAENAAGR